MSTPPPSVLFATWNGGGNVAPVLVLTSGLTKRGAEVVALGEESLRGRFESAGVPFEVRDANRLWDPLATAQDVERVGAGVALSGDASAAEITAAVDDVLHRPDYAGRAREMRRLIAAGPSAIDELVAAAGLEPTAS